MFYTIKVKRRFFPGYKRYKVKGHTTEATVGPLNTPIVPRMVLDLANGDRVIIPRIEDKKWILCADHAALVLAQMTKEHPPAAQEAAKGLQLATQGG